MTGMQPWAIPGLAAGYHLADVNDFSGNSKTMTNTGSVTFGLGKFGNCATFSSGKYLQRASPAIDIQTSAISMFCWANFSSLPGADEWPSLMYWGTSSKRASLYYYNQSGTKKLSAYHGGDNLYAVNLSANVWYHIGMVCSAGAGAAVKLYLNGVPVLAGTKGSGTVDSQYLQLNGWPGQSNYMSGKIDEALFIAAELSPQAVRRLYAFQRGMLI